MQRCEATSVAVPRINCKTPKGVLPLSAMLHPQQFLANLKNNLRCTVKFIAQLLLLLLLLLTGLNVAQSKLMKY